MPDWHAMFSPTVSLLEVFLRGTITYLAIFLLVRVLRRETGSISISDVLVLVLIADAAQNGMSAEYQSLTEGLLLAATIYGWSVLMDWGSFHFSWVGNLVHPPPIELVEDGKLNRRNMRHNLISMDELMSFVRQAGVDDVTRVRRASLEGNGEVSVIPYESGSAT
jgi:uncharacterized membrane protein YcaP (DUF421 family)